MSINDINHYFSSNCSIMRNNKSCSFNYMCGLIQIAPMMGLRPRQLNLRLIFRFSVMRGLPSIRLK